MNLVTIPNLIALYIAVGLCLCGYMRTGSKPVHWNKYIILTFLWPWILYLVSRRRRA